jgi:transcriptional regulator with XRE-family HTH domain
VFTSTVNPLGACSITDDSATISPDSINKLIGGRVRLRRTSLGIRPQQLSKLLRIDQNELDAYEAGAKRIKASLLFRTAKILDVRPSHFFFEVKQRKITQANRNIHRLAAIIKGVRRRSRKAVPQNARLQEPRPNIHVCWHFATLPHDAECRASPD